MDACTRRSSRRAVERSHFVGDREGRSVSALDVPLLFPLLLGLCLASASAPRDPDAPYPRVRAVTPLVRSLIADTAARSLTVRELLARLAGSDVIVHVELTGSAQIPTARTKLVAAVSGVRFLRIAINAGVPFADLAPLLAHELQHVLEIAEEPGAVSEAGVRQLYDRIGRARGGDRYETDAAQQVEWVVRRELSRVAKIGG